LGRLKRAIYARMEEVSFRSGAAVAGAVLAAAGVAITLAVVPGRPGGAVAGAPASRVAAPLAAAPSPVPVSSSSAPAPSSPQATPRPSRTTIPAAVAGDYRPPPSPARASAAWHAATTPKPGGIPAPGPVDRGWPPGHRHHRGPGWWGRHRPPGPWGLSPRHRHR
jgi:hypothetical protein